MDFIIDLNKAKYVDVHALIRDIIVNYSVPLCTSPNSADLAGGGTLISFGKINGILTACHVIAKLKQKRHPSITVYIPSGPINNLEGIVTEIVVTCTIQTIDDLTTIAAKSSFAWSDKWLDITLLVFDDDTYNAFLNAGKKFINLETFYMSYNNNKEAYALIPSTNWRSVLYGYPRMSMQSVIQQPPIVYLPFAGPYYGKPESVNITSKLKCFIRRCNQLTPDLVAIPIDPSKENLPTNFETLSGGGYWQYRQSIKENQLKLSLFFAGVVVSADYDSERKRDTKLFSRGPYSLYGIFCEYLSRTLNEKL